MREPTTSTSPSGNPTDRLSAFGDDLPDVVADEPRFARRDVDNLGAAAPVAVLIWRDLLQAAQQEVVALCGTSEVLGDAKNM